MKGYARPPVLGIVSPVAGEPSVVMGTTLPPVAEIDRLREERDHFRDKYHEILSEKKQAKKLAALHSSEKSDWQTPAEILDPVRSFFGVIDLDPCTTADNPVGASTFYTERDNGLEKPWRGRVFANCPYGYGIDNWLIRAEAEARAGAEIIMLLPSRTDTGWFHDSGATYCCFWRGRLKFVGAENSAPFPSCLLYWPGNNSIRAFAFAEHFGNHGAVVLLPRYM